MGGGLWSGPTIHCLFDLHQPLIGRRGCQTTSWCSSVISWLSYLDIYSGKTELHFPVEIEMVSLLFLWISFIWLL